MKGWILADDTGRQTFGDAFGGLDVEWKNSLPADSPADLEFILALGEFQPALRSARAPLILLNAVTPTLRSMRVDERFVRINGWNTFLQRPLAEVVAPGGCLPVLEHFFAAWGKSMIPLPDQPGMPSARIISMVINEAYFALEEGVSDRPAIDLAMKLGTNYPFGPFEWAEKIGLHRIKDLLDALSREDPLYEAAPLLREEAG